MVGSEAWNGGRQRTVRESRESREGEAVWESSPSRREEDPALRC